MKNKYKVNKKNLFAFLFDGSGLQLVPWKMCTWPVILIVFGEKPKLGKR